MLSQQKSPCHVDKFNTLCQYATYDFAIGEKMSNYNVIKSRGQLPSDTAEHFTYAVYLTNNYLSWS